MLVSIYHLHDTERARARRQPITKPTLVVGSDATCDLRVEDDPQVSPRHITIAMRASPEALVAAIIVTPIVGATLVNGVVISEPTTVQLGDAIRIGNTILKFRPEPHVRTIATSDLPNPEGGPPVPARPAPRRPGPEPVPGNPPAFQPTPPPTHRPPIGNPSFPRPISPPVPPVPYRANAFRAVLSNDPMENEFLVAIRRNPADDATRMVYADWLEQRGHTTHAEFVRTDAHLDAPRFIAESDLDWRAITSRTAIEHCDRPACPRRWDAITPTADDDRVRDCTTCDRRVYFCHDHGLLHSLGIRKDPVAFDASLDRISAHQFYTGSPGEPLITQPDGVDQDNPGDPVDTLRDEG